MQWCRTSIRWTWIAAITIVSLWNVSVTYFQFPVTVVKMWVLSVRLFFLYVFGRLDWRYATDNMRRMCLCLASIFRRRTAFRLLTPKSSAKVPRTGGKSVFGKNGPLAKNGFCSDLAQNIRGSPFPHSPSLCQLKFCPNPSIFRGDISENVSVPDSFQHRRKVIRLSAK